MPEIPDGFESDVTDVPRHAHGLAATGKDGERGLETIMTRL